jgi:hypothetical protein
MARLAMLSAKKSPVSGLQTNREEKKNSRLRRLMANAGDLATSMAPPLIEISFSLISQCLLHFHPATEVRDS